MASSENQGLQIALIIFVILTLILSVTTFLFFRAYEDADQKAVQRAKEAASTDTALRSALDEIDEFKRMLNFKTSDTLDAVKAAYLEDMETYAGAVAEEKRNYREVLTVLTTANVDVNSRLAEEQATVAQLTADLAKVNQSADQRVGVHEQAVQDANTQVTTVQTTFGEQDKRNTKEKEEVVSQAQEVRAKADARIQELQKSVSDAQAKVTTLQRDLKDARVELDRTRVREEFSSADGKIISVDPVKNIVWINLGRADHLTRQTTFSVHDQGNHRLDQAKAHIEVTKVMLDHLSEARILKGDEINPIIRGDMVFSPSWKPGRQVHFALAGEMDLDGDELSDRETVRTLILNSGGVIDAEVDEAGKQTGEVSIRTRYIVIGEQPTLRARDAAAQRGREAVDAYEKLISDAKKVGVEQISLERFLDLVGYSVKPRLLTFGNTTNPAAFGQRPPDGGRPVSRGKLNDAFKRRRPDDEESSSSGDPPTRNRAAYSRSN